MVRNHMKFGGAFGGVGLPNFDNIFQKINTFGLGNLCRFFLASFTKKLATYCDVRTDCDV